MDAAAIAAKHNETLKKPGSNSAGHLGSFVERIERLETEKKDTAEDIRGVYAEAKGAGFDPKVLRAVIRRRGQDRNELAEYEALLETYEASLADCLN